MSIAIDHPRKRREKKLWMTKFARQMQNKNKKRPLAADEGWYLKLDSLMGQFSDVQVARLTAAVVVDDILLVL